MPFAPAIALAALSTGAVSAPPVVAVARDNVEIRQSCTLVFEQPVADLDGNGVVRILADGVTVDLGGRMLDSGLDPSRPEEFQGTGIVVAAKQVTLRGGAVRGFKVAVAGEGCDGSVFEGLDLSDNAAQRLKSTRLAEHGDDWLFPQENDDGGQVAKHGAALSVVASRGIVVREIRVRRTQNGIVLRGVHDSSIYDNDCSFLSGWGLAMWRSTGNTVCRNSFDFCVRGYSHGIYNRGQDSAGILMFEQCSRNIVALNSATHCGDGVFGFSGIEALGQKPPPKDAGAEGDEWYRRRGNCDNVFVRNDLSYAAAHGLEMTFSFGTRIEENRLFGNAICGIWGGYSHGMVVRDNRFGRNGGMAYGRERGGVNIEHAVGAVIIGNRFDHDEAGVALWDDDDPHLAGLPWSRLHGTACSGNFVAGNRFFGEGSTVELRMAKSTRLGEAESRRPGFSEEGCEGTAAAGDWTDWPPTPSPQVTDILAKLPGARIAVGARDHLRGRDAIVMGEHGPVEPSPDRARGPRKENRP